MPPTQAHNLVVLALRKEMASPVDKQTLRLTRDALRDFGRFRPPLEILTSAQVLGRDRARHPSHFPVLLDEKLVSLDGITRLEFLSEQAKRQPTLLLELTLNRIIVNVTDAPMEKLASYPQNNFIIHIYYNRGFAREAQLLHDAILFKLEDRFPDGAYGTITPPAPLYFPNGNPGFPFLSVHASHEALALGDGIPLLKLSEPQISLLPSAFARGIIRIFYGPDAILK